MSLSLVTYAETKNKINSFHMNFIFSVALLVLGVSQDVFCSYAVICLVYLKGEPHISLSEKVCVTMIVQL